MAAAIVAACIPALVAVAFAVVVEIILPQRREARRHHTPLNPVTVSNASPNGPFNSAGFALKLDAHCRPAACHSEFHRTAATATTNDSGFQPVLMLVPFTSLNVLRAVYRTHYNTTTLPDQAVQATWWLNATAPASEEVWRPTLLTFSEPLVFLTNAVAALLVISIFTVDIAAVGSTLTQLHLKKSIASWEHHVGYTVSVGLGFARYGSATGDLHIGSDDCSALLDTVLLLLASPKSMLAGVLAALSLALILPERLMFSPAPRSLTFVKFAHHPWSMVRALLSASWYYGKAPATFLPPDTAASAFWDALPCFSCALGVLSLFLSSCTFVEDAFDRWVTILDWRPVHFESLPPLLAALLLVPWHLVFSLRAFWCARWARGSTPSIEAMFQAETQAESEFLRNEASRDHPSDASIKMTRRRSGGNMRLVWVSFALRFGFTNRASS
ncbi:hypothetical protein CAOG_005744 [Capsaspora owczarzaki ATCC 30864]|uniref:Uncharacterized protein n=1 Tax=Capsaspora owczarzaki (strain ATCC 30864) TaxID=595528 RepID=A0A0D2VV23_CAPO3|nr:hypothetical protein CAOG_005744 [Capsaspora owczarzaki ATCC 30864]